MFLILDYAYLMTYARLAHANSRYYLQLEDDIVASPGMKFKSY